MGKSGLARSGWSRETTRTILDAILDRCGSKRWAHPHGLDLIKICPEVQIKLYHGKRLPTEAEENAIKTFCETLDPKIDVGVLCRELLSPPVEPFGHGAFADIFDLELPRLRSSINFYKGRYLHISTSPVREGYIISECELLDTAWERKLPAYRLTRKQRTSAYSYAGGYFANDRQLFLLGSQENSLDARLHVFNVQAGNNDMLSGVMAGVSYQGMAYASRCCLIKSKLELSSDREDAYSLAEVKEISELAFEFFEKGTSKIRVPRHDFKDE